MSAYTQSLAPVPPPLTMPAQPTKRVSSANNNNATTFEFTRRKKWTDILFSELPDTVLFVLDFTRVIQYANPGASEALGWDVEEMVDMDVLKFINSEFKFAPFRQGLRHLKIITRNLILGANMIIGSVISVHLDDDKEAFCRRFQDSLNRRQELFCYSRLKSKATFSGTNNTDRSATPVHKELLFEIKGHALYLPEHVECHYFFLVAKPYPSRNMAAYVEHLYNLSSSCG